MTNLETKKTKKHPGRVLLLLLAAVLFFLPSPSFAINVAAAAEFLKLQAPESGKKHELWRGKFYKSLNFLVKMDKELHRLSLAVEGGFSGHKAGENNLYKLNIASVISKDIHPHSFTFKGGTSVQYLDNSLKENITTLQLSYDHHLKKWFEFYGFLERFSDSYLSIQQRYEIGCGFKFEFDFGIAKTVKKELDSYKENSQSYKNFICYVKSDPSNKFSKADENSIKKQLDGLKRKAETIKKSLNKKYKILSLGLAFTLFSELENAEINTTVEEENDDGEIVEVSKKFPLPGEQRFRIVIRPSLVLSPVKNLTFKGHIYFKLPIGRPYLVNDTLDLRIDSLFRIEYGLTKGDSWAKKVSIIFEYQRHHDNLPPLLPQSIIDDYIIVGRTAAEKVHDEFLLKLAIQF